VPTGEEHGTITIVADHAPVEVTTLRRDVATDGRRATVAFTDRLEDDAHRRDFTVNALYATPDGTVLDPTGEGLGDLEARRIRFIGTPHDRIREDYLRILRFFRFHAWYADPEPAWTPRGSPPRPNWRTGSTGSRRNGSARRCASFWPRPTRACRGAMAHAGVLMRVLPGAEDRWLAGAGGDLEGDSAARPDATSRDPWGRGRTTRCACRGRRRRRWPGCAKGAGRHAGPGELGYRHGEALARDILLLRAALFGHPVEPGRWDLLKAGANAEFPLKAADLMPGFSGPALGAELLRLERFWIDSGFAMTKDELALSQPDSLDRGLGAGLCAPPFGAGRWILSTFSYFSGYSRPGRT
jgi:poly(A) polymerase